MMYYQVCWLLPLVISAAVIVNCELDDIPLIQWKADCDNYQVTSGKYPGVQYIHSKFSTPLAQCRSLCTDRTDCGGFEWGVETQYCSLYNINDQIIDQYLSQNWYDSYGSPTWYSKTCDFSLGATDLSCDIYTGRQYHNRYPATKWKIADVRQIPNLTATDCAAWCTLYTGCRSFIYLSVDGTDDGDCSLYKTTVGDLWDKGLLRDVVQNIWPDYTYTTYDRYCGDRTPYIPEQK